ncbi:methyltransferase [Bimuria novae-zelandiae CBS 107.79]|uniref:Methyltransferase n=1 Tax=Bimuria novae-zelandiae CBS 107.79 TaxID=1447943 RepID=A0A6A5UJY9_9PLEO|nr:methyltransferase [Bimuria novae-zelandiae CBS 107.79]
MGAQETESESPHAGAGRTTGVQQGPSADTQRAAASVPEVGASSAEAPPIVDSGNENEDERVQTSVSEGSPAGDEDLDVATWDSQSDGGDSAYEELQSQTASVTSSIMAGHWENGRRYHAYQSGQYLFPDDEQEQDRLDVKYAAIHLTYGNKLAFAPLNNPQHALDVGTGTGIWAIDFAEEHPQCTVSAIDLSPIQPTWVPPNVKFEIDDCEQDWTWPIAHFDYVHLRTMAAAIRNWDRLFAQAYRHTRPGGYIELQEMDYMGVIQSTSRNPGTAFIQWCTEQGKAAAKVGINLRMIPNVMVEQLRRAGFVDVTVHEFRCPIGPWAAEKKMRDAGILQLSAVLDGLEGLTLKLSRFYEGWTRQELDVLLAKVRTELKSKECHAYWPVNVVYGRKPE